MREKKMCASYRCRVQTPSAIISMCAIVTYGIFNRINNFFFGFVLLSRYILHSVEEVSSIMQRQNNEQSKMAFTVNFAGASDCKVQMHLVLKREMRPHSSLATANPLVCMIHHFVLIWEINPARTLVAGKCVATGQWPWLTEIEI